MVHVSPTSVEPHHSLGENIASLSGYRCPHSHWQLPSVRGLPTSINFAPPTNSAPSHIPDRPSTNAPKVTIKSANSFPPCFNSCNDRSRRLSYDQRWYRPGITQSLLVIPLICIINYFIPSDHFLLFIISAKPVYSIYPPSHLAGPYPFLLGYPARWVGFVIFI